MSINPYFLGLEQLCTLILRKRLELHENDNTIQLKNTNGPPMKINVGSKSTLEEQTIAHETLFKLKVEYNLSGRKTVGIAKILKDETGSKIQPNFKKVMIEKGHELKEFFEHRYLDLYLYEKDDNTKGKKALKQVKKVMVLCNDFDGLLAYISEARGYERDIKVRVGMDAGGGFLRICMMVEQVEQEVNIFYSYVRFALSCA